MQTKISDMSEMNDVPKQRIKIKKKSQVRMIWQNFRKNKLAMFGLCLLIVMMGLSIFADFFFDYKEDVIKQNISERLQLPSKDHLLGTDQFGRDLFARVVYGGRISLFSGVLIVVLSLAIGSIIGSTAGYYGGKIDNFLMRLMDVILAIPSQLLAISIVAALGPSLFNLLIASTASQVPRFSRIIRSSILTEKEMEYIEAAKACGTSDARIIIRHILPNAIGPIIVQGTLSVGMIILTLASLSFIGLGVQPPTPEWGSMLANSRDQMRYYPHLVIFPGLAIIFSVMALNLIGDGLRDALDPRLRN